VARLWLWIWLWLIIIAFALAAGRRPESSSAYPWAFNPGCTKTKLELNSGHSFTPQFPTTSSAFAAGNIPFYIIGYFKVNPLLASFYNTIWPLAQPSISDSIIIKAIIITAVALHASPDCVLIGLAQAIVCLGAPYLVFLLRLHSKEPSDQHA
jgi:hypothetical protein